MGFRAAAGGTPAGAAAADAAGAGGVATGRRPGPEAVLRPRLLSGAAATLDDDFLRAAATVCTACAAAATLGRRACNARPLAAPAQGLGHGLGIVLG